jgi:penicillin-binding protein 1A
MALPVYGYFMNKLYRDRTLGYSQGTRFEAPEGFRMDLDCSKVMKENKHNNDGDFF